jgi:hypothetical protein
MARLFVGFIQTAELGKRPGENSLRTRPAGTLVPQRAHRIFVSARRILRPTE